MGINTQWLSNRQPNTGARRPLPDDVDGFDYVITSLADLDAVAPAVGGVRTLPNGGYALKPGCTIPTGERLQVTAGGRVRLVGMTPAAGFTGEIDSAAFFTIGSGSIVDLETLALVNNGDNPVVSSGGTVTARSCYLTANGATGAAQALQVSGASWRGSQCNYTAQVGYAINQLGGQWYDNNSTINSVASHGIAASGSASLATLVNCRIVAGLDCAQLVATNMRAEYIGCQMSLGADNRSCLNINGLAHLLVDGGRYYSLGAGVSRVAIKFNGNNTTSVIRGARFNDLNTAIGRVSGTQGYVRLESLVVEDTVSTGILWQTASVPVAGLGVSGCGLLGATPISGFGPADARVLMRQNYDATGPMTESALV